MHITTSQDKSPAVVWKDERNTQRRWNTIKTFQLKERIDLDRLKRIIRTASMRTEFKDDKAKAAHEADIKMLHVLKQQASKTGRYVVPYTLHTCGRYFPGTAELPRVGLASLPRKYRKPLCGEFDTDVDIENAHPTFLKRILEHENISFPLLGEYVTNRTEFCTDATPKETWLALLYGGKPRPGSGGRVNAFSQQAHSALEELFARPAFQTYHDQGKQKCQQKDLYGACDPLHSAFAYLMFECERECVALAMQKLTDKPYKHKISAVIHDGFHIANLHVPDEHLRAAEKHVKAESRYNFEIKLVKKDLTNFDASVLGTEDSSLLGGDAGNALRWLDYMRAQGHEFLRSGKDVHWYHPGQGIYGKDWGSWNTFATNCPCLDEEYQVSTGNQKMMREQIFANVESATSGEFHRRVFDSTHRRLAFQNGVYDFEKGELVDFSPNYLFDRKANVDYNPNLVELEKEVRQKLFVDIVRDEVGEYFIKLLARGLAGEYEDKAFVVLVGLGNSGLGTLTSALTRAFGPYVRNFNACSLQTASGGGDAAKAQSWMCDLKSPVRFAICNETPTDIVLSGDRIKTFSGGGDTITARQNHQDEYEFWLQCLPMIFANDIKYKGDAQTVARMKFIDALYRYLDGENYENEKGQPEVRKADPKLKGWLSREDVQTAFASLLLKAYEATKPVAPDAVRKSIAEWAESDDLCDRLNALFEKTNDPEDFLSFAKIQFKVQQDGCTVSKTLIGRALTKLGFEAKPKKNSGRTVVGRTCIKERGEEE